MKRLLDYLFWSRDSLILETTVPSLCSVWSELPSTVLVGSSIYQIISGGGIPYSAVHSASTSTLLEVLRSTSMETPVFPYMSGSVMATTLSFATNRSTSLEQNTLELSSTFPLIKLVFVTYLHCVPTSGLLSLTWHFHNPVSLAWGDWMVRPQMFSIIL